jgi:hypothetical protein
MIKRALFLTPFIGMGLLVFAGPHAAISGLVGIAMTIANLWLAGRIIGGVADKNPTFLMAGAMAAFTLGLGMLVAVALGLEALDLVDFRVTGVTLVAVHLVVVMIEAAIAFPIRRQSNDPVKARS